MRAAVALLWGVAAPAVAADDVVPPPVPEEPAPLAPNPVPYEVTVFGRHDRALEDVPGSATVITAEDLRAMRPMSANEALATAPGVHVVDEDGIGLRPNVGIRGLDPTRSRNVLVLEDGVPIALAPYGEPEMYYAPPIDRMERLEIVKGSGSIRFGPQTIGGVINYVTPDPTEDLSAHMEFRGGTYGHLQGIATLSDTVGRTGYFVSAFHQAFPGPRALDLARTDVTGKVRFDLGRGHALTFKATLYDEHSAATYLGLTTPQFETDPRFNFAENDEFTVRRIGSSVVHNATIGTSHFRTTGYFNVVERDWWRQDFDRSDLGYDYERVIDGKGVDVTGDPSAWPDDGSAIYFRDSTALRGRTFHVGGIEPTVATTFATGAVDHAVDAGVRFHVEHAHEVRVQGATATARDGETVNEDDRMGVAAAAWVLDRLDLAGGMLQISPGIRLETLWANQRVLRQDGVDHDPPLSKGAVYVAPLPGLGVAVHATPDVTVFAGVHRGWAPPRTKDGVTTGGDVLELEPEHSWNTEVGARAYAGEWLSGEVSGFWLAFQNQVTPPSEAGGATADEIVNAGATTHLGVEATVRVDPTRAVGSAVRVPLSATYSFVHATFGEGWNAAIAGQPLPYAPAHRLTASAGVVAPFGLDGQIEGHYVSAQYTDKVATEEATTDGLVGRIDPYVLLDAQIGYTHAPTGLYVFLACKNLLDTTWIASRAPRGIQPGTPRHVFGGIGWTL